MISEIEHFFRRHWWHLLLLIPGAFLVTLLHEAAHAVAVLLQGGTVNEFVWLPQAGSWGHVLYTPKPGERGFQAMVALAPTMLWLAMSIGACLLCLRAHEFSYPAASFIFFWLYVIPLADIAHAAFPFLAGKANDYAALGTPGAASAAVITVVAPKRSMAATARGVSPSNEMFVSGAATAMAFC
ncbi:MAG: hypothetical protein U1G07_23455 [Verrucomicrobiota bacterium]